MLQNKEHYHLLLDQITPFCEGVIWITKEKLSTRPFLFAELDYLTNGLLTKFIKENVTYPSHKNIFFTKNFDHTIFVAHLHAGEISKGDLEIEIAHIVEWTRQFFADKKGTGEILLAHNNANFTYEKVCSKYENGPVFKELNLS